MKWEIFDYLEELRLKLSKKLEKLTPLMIQSVTGLDFILESLFSTIIPQS
ncbi:hypothetical protein GLO73106DRAFT_00016400 [Gloeocapsa sp. PCC 73106]|nr:hypothetical protein GLO73106DRAFT_00016400 [Gloeocapsa sp. PCC 73106]